MDLLAVQGTLKESSLVSQFESINSLVLSLLYGPTLTSIHDYWKNHNFDHTDFVGKVISLLFNMLSRFAIDLIPRSKFPFICLLLFIPSLETGGCVYPREIYTPDKMGLF